MKPDSIYLLKTQKITGTERAVRNLRTCLFDVNWEYGFPKQMEGARRTWMEHMKMFTIAFLLMTSAPQLARAATSEQNPFSSQCQKAIAAPKIPLLGVATNDNAVSCLKISNQYALECVKLVKQVDQYSSTVGQYVSCAFIVTNSDLECLRQAATTLSTLQPATILTCGDGLADLN